jgi:hypothetical protein
MNRELDKQIRNNDWHEMFKFAGQIYNLVGL